MIASHLLKFCHFCTDNGYDDFELYCLRNKDKEEIDFFIQTLDEVFQVM